MPIHLAEHPLLSHKMTMLRNVNTSTSDFRKLLKEITFYLGYEASRSLASTEAKISTPMKVEFKGTRIGDKVAIIPILRAGLSMADGMLELIPFASVHHIGMFRTKESLMPIQYYNRLPRDVECDVAYIVDPCIASSNTIHAVITILKKWGAKKIVVVSAIASTVGIAKLQELHPEIDVHIAAIDDRLSEDGMIVPGIGDAGDRQFGTPFEEVVEIVPPELDMLPSPSKKSRKGK
jgi:uracil phosphoribosyltransferase